jgi:tRNA-2-methylthio-N6-dimethylallyladenosine synthase
VKNDRLQRVLVLQKRINFEKNSAMVGKTLEVLPETINPRFPDTLTGRTRTNQVVTFPGSRDLLGKFVSIEITEAHPFRLSGRIVNGGQ